jgi:hypothetical protein
MKKIILIFAILGIINPSVFSATFTLKYGSTNLSSQYVYIYQNGKQIASSSTNSSGVATFTLPAGNYSYKTATNFSGDITASSSVSLDHKKLTFTVNDNLGNPISSERITVYEDGIEVTYKTTNSSGVAEFYLKPSDKYAYKTSFNQSAVSLLNDATITLTKNNISVIAKYQNYPVADNFTLYLYSDRSNAIASYVYSSATNGEINFNVVTGRYWLKNKLNIYTELNVTSTNQQFYLDYKKVRFISNQTDPNILFDIKVSNGNGSDTKITDGKGYADFYLLPGTYTYSHLGMTETFTVVNDMEINISTYTVNFTLKNAATQSVYATKSFQVGKDMNNLTSYTTNASGTCQVRLKAGSYIFSEGISSYSFTISSNGQTITPPLYDVTFNITQNLPNATLDYIYVTSINTGKSVSYNPYTNGMNLCLLSGDYNFRCQGDGFSYSHLIPFQVNQNTTVQGFYKFQLNITDGSSASVSGQNYYIKQDGNYVQTSFTTNNQGTATAYLPNGNYQLYDTKTQEETPFVINNQDKTLNLQLPNEITLTVKKDGQNYSGYVVLYNEQKTSQQSIQITNGIGKARLSAGSTYYAVISAVGTSAMLSKIVISNSSNVLDFILLQIKTEGNGIAFPYVADLNYTVYYLKGNTVRLAAVPMKNWTCTKWTINGADITNDLIDYTLNSTTIATAVFEQNSSTGIGQVRSANNNLTIYPNPANSHINFSENVNGNAYIYSSNGVLAKQIYVLGNGINVSDLQTGLYVLVIESENQTYKSSFIKE